MPTLSVVRKDIATITKWLGIILGSILIIFILFRTALFLKNIIAPTPPAPPEEKFGKLPAIIFPQSSKKDFKYKVDTITGFLPNLPDRSKVYKMVHPDPNLLAVQRASEKVASLNFDPTPKQVSDIFYRWASPKSPFQVLTLNVNLAQFSLTSSFLTDEDVLSGENFPNESYAILKAQSFLQTLDLYPEDLDEEKTATKFLRISNGNVVDASSLSNANLISVYFFQENKDDFPIVYPVGHLSTMNLTIGGGEFDAQVIDGRFFYQKISDSSSTYPIKTTNEAFEDLKVNHGFIASYNGDGGSVSIKKVYLAYYVSGVEQDFLLPVIVFEGNDNFMAYVSAIKDESISN